MILVSITFGVVMGLFFDTSRFCRALLGVRYEEERCRRIYSRVLPFCRSGESKSETGRVRGIVLAVVIFVQDIFLFTIAGAGVALINYYFNNGRPRFYTPAAMVLGFLCYYFTVGMGVRKVIDLMAFITKAIIVTIFALFYKPLRIIIEKIGFIAKKLCTNLYNTIAKKAKKVYNSIRKSFAFFDTEKCDENSEKDDYRGTKMTSNKYFKGKRTAASMLIQGFLVLLFVFAVVFFLWSLMNYNEKMKETEEQHQKIEQLNDEIEQMQYLVEAPLDNDYKMRIAREKLGMCFPDEIIFHTDGN